MAVMAVGNMNLAMGAMGAGAAMAAGGMIQLAGLPIWLSLIGGLAVGTLLGAFQGLLVTRTRISPFVITLALASVYEGLATGLFSGQILNQIPKTFVSINTKDVLGTPVLLLVAFGFVILFSLLTYKTTMGRKMLATGANERAANCAGHNTKNICLFSHSLSGFLASVAGIMTITTQGSAQVSIGSDWMLLSFAGPALGGCLLTGGKINAIGALLGAILLTLIKNALTILGVSYFWFNAFLGVLLLLAFEIERMRGSVTTRMKIAKI